MTGYQHQRSLEQFAHPGTLIYERTYEVDDQATIRVIHFIPGETSRGLPIVIVPGLSSVMESFMRLLQDITRTHSIVYVETREKPSSKIRKNCRFDIPAFGRDIEVALSMAGLKDKGYILTGYSLGATAIMEGYNRLTVKPAHLVLAEPVPQFRIPAWSLPLARWAPQIFPLLKPFAKWYMRNFMIDTLNDPEVMKIVERALDSADPYKLGQTLLSVHRFEAWDRLQEIDSPTLIVSTSADTLHHHEDIIRMKDLIKSCTLLDLTDNKRTHNHEMGEILRGIS
jgi:pimeloyl-ACP methyl ester carboxylesterase